MQQNDKIAIVCCTDSYGWAEMRWYDILVQNFGGKNTGHFCVHFTEKCTHVRN